MMSGTNVAVRSHFVERAWSRGFTIVETVVDRDFRFYRLRRRSDRWVLPVLFDEDDVCEDTTRSHERAP
jgi:hypothetical protein